MEETSAPDISAKCNWKNPWIAVKLVALLVVGSVLIISLLRERIVSPVQNQVGITGQGRVAYQPDTATVTLGVQIDKVPKADEALNQLNEKAKRIIEAVIAEGIAEADIKTEAYTLSPQYDFKDGVTVPSGYSATQNISVKVKGIKDNSELAGRIISVASGAGANQITGIKFEAADINALKQEARKLALQDARGKADELAQAAGVRRLGKVVGWYESPIQVPGEPIPFYGMGAAEDKAVQSAQIPTGTQEVIIEMTLNYEVK